MPSPKRKSRTSGDQPTKKPGLHLPVPVQSTDPLTTYMAEVGRYPLLSREEESQLAVRYHQTGDMIAFKTLVQSNLRFVIKIAFEYSKYGAKVLDLIQEGNMGLLRAVKEFDPGKDVRLTTYAVYWIRSYIQDYLLRNWSLVRIGTTAAQKKLFYNLKKIQARLEQEGVVPQPKAIAMDLGVEEDDVRMMQERLQGGDVSLSRPVREDSRETAENFVAKLPDQSELVSDELEAHEQAALFKKALGEFEKTLKDRDLEIFRDRLLSESPVTLLEIGERYKVSKERARQLEEKIKTQLKKFLQQNYPDISLD